MPASVFPRCVAACLFGVVASTASAQNRPQANPPSLPDIEVSARPPLDTSPDTTSNSSARLDRTELRITTPNTLSEAALKVPGLFTSGSSPRNIGFTIRGLGNNQFNDGIDSGVGIYIDGIYHARQLYGALSLHDLEDVLVLRGPQGAAYGLDSTAGEIHLRTQAPSFTPSTQMQLSAGNYDYQRIAVQTTGTLKPGVMAGRLSLIGQVRDGTLTNVFDGSDVNNQSRQGVRGQLLITPNAELTARLSAEYTLMNQRCCAFGLLAPVSARIQASDEYMGYQRVGTNPNSRLVDNDIPTRNRLQRESLSAVVEWTPPGRHRVVSLTGYSALRYAPSRLDDGTSLRLIDSSITSESRQVTQELRLHSRFRRVNTTVGLFLMHQNLGGLESAMLKDQIARWAIGGQLRQRVPTLNQQNSGALIDAVLPPSALNGLTLSTPYSQVSNTASAFASADWVLPADTVLTTGLRFTTSQRRAQISRSRSGGNLNSSPLSLTNALIPLGNLLGQDLRGVTYEGIIDSLAGQNFDRSDSRRDQGVSGKLALSRQLNASNLVYASATRGYKSGGLNLAGLSSRVEPQFSPETATNLELGLKHARPDSKLAYNVSLYNTRVRNFQALTHDEGDGLLPNPRPNNVLNIPKVQLQGLEGDVNWAVTPTLQLGGGLAYNRAISTVFPNAPNEDTGQNNKDLSGKQLYNAPRWSGFVSVFKRFPLQNGHDTYVAFDTTFRSSTFGVVDQSRNTFIDSYSLSNLRVGYRNPGAGWGVQLWVNNLFDEQYLAALSNLYSVGEYGGFAGDPRTYGLTLDLQLGR